MQRNLTGLSDVLQTVADIEGVFTRESALSSKDQVKLSPPDFAASMSRWRIFQVIPKSKTKILEKTALRFNLAILPPLYQRSPTIFFLWTSISST